MTHSLARRESSGPGVSVPGKATLLRLGDSLESCVPMFLIATITIGTLLVL